MAYGTTSLFRRVRVSRILSIAVLALSHLVYAQDQETFAVYSNASDIYPLPSSPECANALATSLQCPDTILLAIPSTSSPISNLTSAELEDLCAPTCHQSLVSATAQVNTACAGWPYILGDTSYVASFPYVFLHLSASVFSLSSTGSSGFRIFGIWYESPSGLLLPR